MSAISRLECWLLQGPGRRLDVCVSPERLWRAAIYERGEFRAAATSREGMLYAIHSLGVLVDRVSTAAPPEEHPSEPSRIEPPDTIVRT